MYPILVVSIKYLRRVLHADRERLLLRTPGPVPLGLAYILLVETNPLPILTDYALRISLGTFSILLRCFIFLTCTLYAPPGPIIGLNKSMF